MDNILFNILFLFIFSGTIVQWTFFWIITRPEKIQQWEKPNKRQIIVYAIPFVLHLYLVAIASSYLVDKIENWTSQ